MAALSIYRKAGKRGRVGPATAAKFRKVVLDHYKKHRRPLAWRKTKDPYHIVVSEIMLQQTQVDRVSVKFEEFIQAFPTFEKLAHAKFDTVLKVWQGMGYNRRAKSLYELAKTVVKDHKGKLPRDPETLQTLPGIGPATSASIAAFAFNKPTVFLETNIRTVYIHFFFEEGVEVHDDQLIPLVEQTLDTKNPNRWYNALMDYGTVLKKEIGNVSRRSRHYVKQSTFEGSNRQVRSMIVKMLLKKPNLTVAQISKQIGKPVKIVRTNLSQLVNEGLVDNEEAGFVIAS